MTEVARAGGWSRQRVAQLEASQARPTEQTADRFLRAVVAAGVLRDAAVVAEVAGP